MAGDHVPEGYRRWMARYRHGPGVFTIDWSLSEPGHGPGPAPSAPRRWRPATPNEVGGEISNGEASLWQMLARPVPRRNPYRTPLPGTCLASAATPPGPAVHGMCGDNAARVALREVFGVCTPAAAARGLLARPGDRTRVRPQTCG